MLRKVEDPEPLPGILGMVIITDLIVLPPRRKVKSKLYSLLATLRTVAHQTPLLTGSSWQEYWSGLSFPSPEDLTDTGLELLAPASPALAGGFFTTVPPQKPCLPFQILYLVYQD